MYSTSNTIFVITKVIMTKVVKSTKKYFSDFCNIFYCCATPIDHSVMLCSL